MISIRPGFHLAKRTDSFDQTLRIAKMKDQANVGGQSFSNRPLVPRPIPQTSGATASMAPECTTTSRSRDEWLDIYPHIERLYVRERRTLRHVMWYMEHEHHFVASAAAYKKRLKKWGFMKSKKMQRTEGMDVTSHKSSRESPGSTVSVTRTPALCPSEAAHLLFMTKARDWIIEYFQKALVPPRTDCAPKFEAVHYSIKLAAELLSRKHGTLAGRLVRRAFLQLEYALDLDPPTLIWNLTELLYNVAIQRQLSLLEILSAYLLNLARRWHPEAHPFVQVLLSLCRMTSHSLSLERLPLILTQAAVLNAELTLVEYFHHHYYSLYESMLWDNCSIRFPSRVRRRANPFSHENAAARKSHETQPRGAAGQALSNNDLVRKLSQLDLDDPKIAGRVLPGRIRATIVPTSEPFGKIPKIHARIAASLNNVVAEMLAREGNYTAAVKRLKLAITLQEYGLGAYSPRTALSMLHLETVLEKSGQASQATEIQLLCSELLQIYCQEASLCLELLVRTAHA
ncbi:hypothetical protein GQ53DRAFT_808628 [Thozetella sp. PMI_491]|nr:hypothetical protein GQ53DRAFT_808628 [Thozetella sp. PMI_491]